MTDELKSCPFCGGPAMVEHINVESVGEGRWSVGCCDPTEGDCQGYQSLTTFARRCDAVAAWNRRVPLQCNAPVDAVPGMNPTPEEDQ